MVTLDYKSWILDIYMDIDSYSYECEINGNIVNKYYKYYQLNCYCRRNYE